jgi:hypothetical protein
MSSPSARPAAEQVDLAAGQTTPRIPSRRLTTGSGVVRGLGHRAIDREGKERSADGSGALGSVVEAETYRIALVGRHDLSSYYEGELAPADSSTKPTPNRTMLSGLVVPGLFRTTDDLRAALAASASRAKDKSGMTSVLPGVNTGPLPPVVVGDELVSVQLVDPFVGSPSVELEERTTLGLRSKAVAAIRDLGESAAKSDSQNDSRALGPSSSQEEIERYIQQPEAVAPYLNDKLRAAAVQLFRAAVVWADAFILVYDVTDTLSFDIVGLLTREILSHFVNTQLPLVALVAVQSGERQHLPVMISHSEGLGLSMQLRCLYFDTLGRSSTFNAREALPGAFDVKTVISWLFAEVRKQRTQTRVRNINMHSDLKKRGVAKVEISTDGIRKKDVVFMTTDPRWRNMKKIWLVLREGVLYFFNSEKKYKKRQPSHAEMVAECSCKGLKNMSDWGVHAAESHTVAAYEHEHGRVVIEKDVAAQIDQCFVVSSLRSRTDYYFRAPTERARIHWYASPRDLCCGLLTLVPPQGSRSLTTQFHSISLAQPIRALN